MIENRKFIRLRTLLPVEYRLIKKHKKQKTVAALMNNISIGGLSLVLKETFRVGDLVWVGIQVPHLEDPVEIVGDVMWHWTSKNKEKPSQEAGIRFQDANPGELNKILDYVYSVAIG